MISLLHIIIQLNMRIIHYVCLLFKCSPWIGCGVDHIICICIYFLLGILGEHKIHKKKIITDNANVRVQFLICIMRVSRKEATLRIFFTLIFPKLLEIACLPSFFLTIQPKYKKKLYWLVCNNNIMYINIL